jgi:phosphoglycolate phosphatase-like HAD superfamily hydrolase
LARVLALDFDGVISDSAPESFALALLTYAQQVGATRFGALAAALESGPLPDADRLAADGLYAEFLELMPLGNRAEDFAISLCALEAGRALADQRDYDAFRAELDEGWLRAFHARFYENRAAFARRDPLGWRRLMKPYPRFLEILRRRAGDALLAIVTSKDAVTVELLIRDYGLEALFDADCVLDKEAGVRKDAHLRRLRAKLGVGFGEISFVDDKVNHLDCAAALGVECALASWGYNGAREIALARRRGYRVCTLDDAEAQLFGNSRAKAGGAARDGAAGAASTALRSMREQRR